MSRLEGRQIPLGDRGGLRKQERAVGQARWGPEPAAVTAASFPPNPSSCLAVTSSGAGTERESGPLSGGRPSPGPRCCGMRAGDVPVPGRCAPAARPRTRRPRTLARDSGRSGPCAEGARRVRGGRVAGADPARGSGTAAAQRGLRGAPPACGWESAWWEPRAGAVAGPVPVESVGSVASVRPGQELLCESGIPLCVAASCEAVRQREEGIPPEGRCPWGCLGDGGACPLPAVLTPAEGPGLLPLIQRKVPSPVIQNLGGGVLKSLEGRGLRVCCTWHR